jgi:DNA-directed RNA polymerase subunit RPC12/RpoP
MYYLYKCVNCSGFLEVTTKTPKKRCPYCKKHQLVLRKVSIQHASEGNIIGTAPYVCIKQEPKTLRHIADRNTAKLGKYEREAQLMTDKEHCRILERKKNAPWWRPNTSEPSKQAQKAAASMNKANKGLKKNQSVKLTPEAKNYIEQGI